MPTKFPDDLPSQIREYIERSGWTIDSWQRVDVDDERPGSAMSFHLVGVLQLLCEAGAVLGLNDDLSKREVIPRERPPDYELPPSLRFHNWSADVEEVGLELEITSWAEMRSALRRGMTRAFWGYALLKFCAAMPKPPVKRKGKQKDDWGLAFTRQWLDDNPDIEPLYNQYWDIRNSQVAHRGSWETPKGAIEGRYIVTTNDGMMHDLNFNLADPELNYDPGPAAVAHLELLIRNALAYVGSQHARLAEQE